MVLTAFQGRCLPLATLASAFPQFPKRLASDRIMECMLKKSCSGAQNPGWRRSMVLGGIRKEEKSQVEQVGERPRALRVE